MNARRSWPGAFDCEERMVKWTFAGCRRLLLVALLIFPACVPYKGESPQADAGLEGETNGQENIERKSPPFFIYRPGAGVTVEGPESDWQIRL